MDQEWPQESLREPRVRKDSDVAEDYNIQSTNDDASECKASAVNIGYWKDSFVKYFIKKSDRKAPEIHRGYYARVKCIRMLIDNFLRVGTFCFIVVDSFSVQFSCTQVERSRPVFILS